jgi:nucleoside-diphosphate-sugar epimerase
MRILVIGGTGFIGPPLIRQLAAAGHSVAVFHRGSSTAAFPRTVEHILGNRHQLADARQAFRRFVPDIVIDLILSSGTQAAKLMEICRGITGRVIAISSIDVYRAVGVLHGSESGALEPLPLTEQSALRTKLQTYPPSSLQMLKSVFEWLDDDYDKIPVEQKVLSDPQLPGTVLRLPMIYGPGDRLHRFFPMLKRMDDGRQRILLSADVAAWRSPRGYVENVAAAIASAATNQRSAGRIYNVAEEPAFSEIEWAKKIAAQTGWSGKFIVLPPERMPKHLLMPGNLAQHWVASSQHIRHELGYRETVDLARALQKTIAWERANPPAQMNPQQFDYAAEDAALAEWYAGPSSRI